MNPGMKMLMISNTSKRDQVENFRNETRANNGFEDSGIRAESNGTYNKMNMGYDNEMRSGGPGMRGNRMNMRTYDMESRPIDQRGREHYENGHFASMRNEMNTMDNGYKKMDNSYNREEFPHMNTIGFYAGPEIDQGYHMDADYRGRNELGEWQSEESRKGHAKSHETIPFSKEMAEAWTRSMTNEDGTKGPHWSIEQAKQVMAQKGINEDPWKFYATLNAIYSDYSAVFRKHGVGDKLDFYIDMAKAWINDKDAVSDKLSKYYEYIVKK